MSYIEINYSITTQTDFLIGSGLSIAGIVDRGCMKDSLGFIYIPGSSIKGRVRYYCKQLLQLNFIDPEIALCQTLANPEICRSEHPCLMCRLFGSNYYESSVQFHDAKLEKKSQIYIKGKNALDVKYQTTLRTNNKINRYTKIAEEAHLFTSEVGGKGFVFEGKITGELQGTIVDKMPFDLAIIIAAMRLVDYIGGQKSRGMGSCEIKIESISIERINYSL